MIMVCDICNEQINIMQGPSEYTFRQRVPGGAWWLVHRRCIEQVGGLVGESVDSVVIERVGVI